MRRQFPSRCECDFDDDTSTSIYTSNSTESSEILLAMSGEDEDYADVSKPTCSRSCENGSCIDTDTCLCDSGYQPSHVDKFDCEPICGEADIENTGCTNGVCIAPQVCECSDGFVLSQVHPFTCDRDDDNGNTHEYRDASLVFWVLMGAVLASLTLAIIALLVWTICERKATYVVDENGNIDFNLGFCRKKNPNPFE